MKKIFFVAFKYIIFIGLIVYVLFNPTARKLFLGYVQIHSLKTDIKEAKEVNLEYKKRLYYLETKPEYMDRIVKEELEVLAEDEIEYRFEKTEKK
ncbi:MAG: hypothetical protein II816_06145 [Elusimicrobia bacterium]|nr:hypothetical protein [Elusimicrobiota bacterium]